MSFGLPDPVQEVINAVSTALPTAPSLPSMPPLSVGLPDVVSEVSHMLDGLGSGGSSDDSSSDNASSSDTSSSGADGGPIAVARTNSDLDHGNSLTLNLLRIRLLNAWSKPMPNAPYHLIAGGQEWEDAADGAGWVEKQMLDVPAQCIIEWNYSPDSQSVSQGQFPSDEEAEPSVLYIYRQELRLDYAEADQEGQIERRLHNLGHSAGATVQDNIMAFQRHYSRPEGPTGNIVDVQADLESWHDDADPKLLTPDQSWDLLA